MIHGGKFESELSNFVGESHRSSSELGSWVTHGGNNDE